jgi:hypothetical protein
MGVKLLNPVRDLHDAPHFFGQLDDFFQFVSGDLWTDTSGDTGAAVANPDAIGGQVTLTTGGTDNNECYLLSTRELLLFAANQPFTVQCRLKFTEANTDDANVAFGVMNAVGADSILDDGGGPKASFSGAVWFKKDGETRWRTRSSIGTTATSSETDQTSGGGGWQTLRIEFVPYSSTLGKITFSLDPNGGQNIFQAAPYDTTNVRLLRVEHEIDFTSATEMNVFVGAKAGGANSEVVTVDYIGFWQAR